MMDPFDVDSRSQSRAPACDKPSSDPKPEQLIKEDSACRVPSSVRGGGVAVTISLGAADEPACRTASSVGRPSMTITRRYVVPSHRSIRLRGRRRSAYTVEIESKRRNWPQHERACGLVVIHEGDQILAVSAARIDSSSPAWQGEGVALPIQSGSAMHVAGQSPEHFGTRKA